MPKKIEDGSPPQTGGDDDKKEEYSPLQKLQWQALKLRV